MTSSTASLPNDGDLAQTLLTIEARLMTNTRRPRLAGRREVDMAKGQLRGNKEAKKPKADKPKGSGSAYKQSLGKGGQALSPQSAKKG